MPVQVSCKFDESPVKNEFRRYLVFNIFSIRSDKKKRHNSVETIFAIISLWQLRFWLPMKTFRPFSAYQVMLQKCLTKLVSEIFSFESIDNVRRQRMDDGRLLYYIEAHISAQVRQKVTMTNS